MVTLSFLHFSLFQLENTNRTEHQSVDMEGAQKAIQLVTTVEIITSKIRGFCLK